MSKMSIKKGDVVTVIAGKDTGKSGKVMQVLPEANRLIVDGVNVFKKHQRPKKQGEKGQIVNVSRSIHRSNVAKKD